jgi:hypothetical protein
METPQVSLVQEQGTLLGTIAILSGHQLGLRSETSLLGAGADLGKLRVGCILPTDL